MSISLTSLVLEKLIGCAAQVLTWLSAKVSCKNVNIMVMNKCLIAGDWWLDFPKALLVSVLSAYAVPGVGVLKPWFLSWCQWGQHGKRG